MLWTERDEIISNAVNGMVGMSYDEIADYLTRCKGIAVDAQWLPMYRSINA